MPTYEYACTECGERLEVVQRFSDEPLTACVSCDGRLRKVFSPVGIVFKGSGFYRTDSRSGSVPSGGNGKSGADGGSSSGSDGTGSSSAGESSAGVGKSDGSGSGGGVSAGKSEGAAKSSSAGSGGSVGSAGASSKVA